MTTTTKTQDGHPLGFSSFEIFPDISDRFCWNKLENIIPYELEV